MKLSIVVPALNEADAIRGVVEGCLAAGPKLAADAGVSELEVVVVDDGSTDQTAAIVGSIPGARLVSHPRNLGYGRALKTGFDAATGDLLGFLDGDGTCDPLFFEALCREAIGANADIVLGSRLHAGSQMPVLRRVGNALFAALVSVWSGRRVSDSASGMRVLRASVWPRLQPLPDGLSFTPAMSCRALFDSELKIVEVPMPYRERQGKSKLSVVRDGFRFLGIIVLTALTYQPFRFYAAGGGLFLAIALAYAIYPAVLYARSGGLPQWMQYRLVTVFVLSVCGLNMLCVGHLSQRLMDLANAGRLRSPSWLQTLIDRALFRYLLPLGTFLVALGVVLNADTIWQYATTLTIQVSWWQVVVGGLLVTAGMMFLVFDTLSRAVRLLAQRSEELKRAQAVDRERR
ncbi:MAG: glycosyltransferase family 2 protein [Candidatus Wallbacteria bacterium]|nr:glycosyltransferase family 2 protein [Candidatus Wallbacteria bacterium]